MFEIFVVVFVRYLLCYAILIVNHILKKLQKENVHIENITSYNYCYHRAHLDITEVLVI